MYIAILQSDTDIYTSKKMTKFENDFFFVRWKNIRSILTIYTDIL